MNFLRTCFSCCLPSVFALSSMDANIPVVEASSNKYKVIIIGAAGQKANDYYQELKQRQDVEVVALVVNKTVPEKIQKLGIPIYSADNFTKVLQEVDFDIAVISVPHFQHDALTRQLLAAGKKLIKEKPLALKASDAQAYQELITNENIPPIFTTVQRETMPLFIEGQKMLELIGTPRSFTYEYCFNLPGVTTGWRANKESSGGGVVMDMGYHIIDVLHRFFGLTEDMEVVFDYQYDSMREEGLEDYAKVIFNTTAKYPGLRGTMILNRHATEKKEIFCIVGSEATMTITPSACVVKGLDGTIMRELTNPYDKKAVISDLFDFCLGGNKAELMKAFEHNVQNVEIIETIYKKQAERENSGIKIM